MKSERLVIETPEKIVFTYDIAGVGARVAAFTLDALIQFVILGVVLFFMQVDMGRLAELNSDRTLFYVAALLIMLFLFQWGYFAFFEAAMNGRTPGKKVCRIRVIRQDGSRLDIQCLVIRNLLRSADSLPLPYFNFLGGLISLLNKKRKRLGDFAAGTVVISDSVFSLVEPDFSTNVVGRGSRYLTLIGTGNRLSEKDLYILRRVINNVRNMPPEQAQRTTAQLVEKLKKRFDLSAMKDFEDLSILKEVYKAHGHEDAK